jgi:hypothetical protein
MYISGHGEVNETVSEAFDAVYYEYYSQVGGSEEYIVMYRNYGHKMLKGLLLTCAYTLLATGQYTGSETDRMLRRYRIRIVGSVDEMRTQLDSHFAKNTLELSHSKKRIDDYLKANASHRKVGLLETLARISDYLGYNIGAGSITLAEFCEYHRLVNEKEKSRVRNEKPMRNGKRKH